MAVVQAIDICKLLTQVALSELLSTIYGKLANQISRFVTSVVTVHASETGLISACKYVPLA